MTRLKGVVVTLGLLAWACAPGTESSDGEGTRLSVGMHELSMQWPEGWERRDLGSVQVFVNSTARISLTDLGPITPAALRRELELAEELFMNGQVEDGNRRLRRIPVGSFVRSEPERQDLIDAWRAAQPEPEFNPYELEDVIDAALDLIDALPPPRLREVAHEKLGELDLMARREVARSASADIKGREGHRIDTWDALSHDHRQRHVFIINAENLLLARTESGPFTTTEPALTALLDSLLFHSSDED